MPAINTKPRKTKPLWLKAPCSSCDSWEEDESSLDPLRKALWNNQGIPDGNRCKYDPLFCNPDDMKKCPFQHLLGKTIIGLRCDMCTKEYEYLEPTDPRLEEHLRDPFMIDICPECQSKKDKDLKQTRFITILES